MPNIARHSDNERFSINPGTEHLILCEGRDDESFLLHYINSSIFSDYDRSVVQVDQMGGVDKMPAFVKTLPSQDGFSRLRSLLIIIDADKNPSSARDKVKGALQRAGLPFPGAEHQWSKKGALKTGYLLFPSCDEQSQAGALEDLCWELLNEKYGPLIRGEVDGFIGSLEADGKRTIKHRMKSLLHTYFSATEELIASGIGRASEAGVFDWTSLNLDALRDFLVDMMNPTI